MAQQRWVRFRRRWRTPPSSWPGGLESTTLTSLPATVSDVTGLATAGETQLLEKVIRGERDRVSLDPDDAAAVLDEIPDDESVFNEKQPI